MRASPGLLLWSAWLAVCTGWEWQDNDDRGAYPEVDEFTYSVRVLCGHGCDDVAVPTGTAVRVELRLDGLSYDSTTAQWNTWQLLNLSAGEAGLRLVNAFEGGGFQDPANRDLWTGYPTDCATVDARDVVSTSTDLIDASGLDANGMAEAGYATFTVPERAWKVCYRKSISRFNATGGDSWGSTAYRASWDPSPAANYTYAWRQPDQGGGARHPNRTEVFFRTRGGKLYGGDFIAVEVSADTSYTRDHRLYPGTVHAYDVWQYDVLKLVGAGEECVDDSFFTDNPLPYPGTFAGHIWADGTLMRPIFESAAKNAIPGTFCASMGTRGINPWLIETFRDYGYSAATPPVAYLRLPDVDRTTTLRVCYSNKDERAERRTAALEDQAPGWRVLTNDGSASLFDGLVVHPRDADAFVSWTARDLSKSTFGTLRFDQPTGVRDAGGLRAYPAGDDYFEPEGDAFKVVPLSLFYAYPALPYSEETSGVYPPVGCWRDVAGSLGSSDLGGHPRRRRGWALDFVGNQTFGYILVPEEASLVCYRRAGGGPWRVLPRVLYPTEPFRNVTYAVADTTAGTWAPVEIADSTGMPTLSVARNTFLVDESAFFPEAPPELPSVDPLSVAVKMIKAGSSEKEASCWTDDAYGENDYEDLALFNPSLASSGDPTSAAVVAWMLLPPSEEVGGDDMEKGYLLCLRQGEGNWAVLRNPRHRENLISAVGRPPRRVFSYQEDPERLRTGVPLGVALALADFTEGTVAHAELASGERAFLASDTVAVLRNGSQCWQTTGVYPVADVATAYQESVYDRPIASTASVTLTVPTLAAAAAGDDGWHFCFFRVGTQNAFPLPLASGAAQFVPAPSSRVAVALSTRVGGATAVMTLTSTTANAFDPAGDVVKLVLHTPSSDPLGIRCSGPPLQQTETAVFTDADASRTSMKALLRLPVHDQPEPMNATVCFHSSRGVNWYTVPGVVAVPASGVAYRVETDAVLDPFGGLAGKSVVVLRFFRACCPHRAGGLSSGEAGDRAGLVAKGGFCGGGPGTGFASLFSGALAPGAFGELAYTLWAVALPDAAGMYAVCYRRRGGQWVEVKPERSPDHFLRVATPGPALGGAGGNLLTTAAPAVSGRVYSAVSVRFPAGTPPVLTQPAAVGYFTVKVVPAASGFQRVLHPCLEPADPGAPVVVEDVSSDSATVRVTAPTGEGGFWVCGYLPGWGAWFLVAEFSTAPSHLVGGWDALSRRVTVSDGWAPVRNSTPTATPGISIDSGIAGSVHDLVKLVPAAGGGSPAPDCAGPGLVELPLVRAVGAVSGGFAAAAQTAALAPGDPWQREGLNLVCYRRAYLSAADSPVPRAVWHQLAVPAGHSREHGLVPGVTSGVLGEYNLIVSPAKTLYPTPLPVNASEGPPLVEAGDVVQLDVAVMTSHGASAAVMSDHEKVTALLSVDAESALASSATCAAPAGFWWGGLEASLRAGRATFWARLPAPPLLQTAAFVVTAVPVEDARAAALTGWYSKSAAVDVQFSPHSAAYSFVLDPPLGELDEVYTSVAEGHDFEVKGFIVNGWGHRVALEQTPGNPPAGVVVDVGSGDADTFRYVQVGCANGEPPAKCQQDDEEAGPAPAKTPRFFAAANATGWVSLVLNAAPRPEFRGTFARRADLVLAVFPRRPLLAFAPVVVRVAVAPVLLEAAAVRSAAAVPASRHRASNYAHADLPLADEAARVPPWKSPDFGKAALHALPGHPFRKNVVYSFVVDLTDREGVPLRSEFAVFDPVLAGGGAGVFGMPYYGSVAVPAEGAWDTVPRAALEVHLVARARCAAARPCTATILLPRGLSVNLTTPVWSPATALVPQHRPPAASGGGVTVSVGDTLGAWIFAAVDATGQVDEFDRGTLVVRVLSAAGVVLNESNGGLAGVTEAAFVEGRATMSGMLAGSACAGCRLVFRNTWGLAFALPYDAVSAVHRLRCSASPDPRSYTLPVGTTFTVFAQTETSTGVNATSTAAVEPKMLAGSAAVNVQHHDEGVALRNGYLELSVAVTSASPACSLRIQAVRDASQPWTLSASTAACFFSFATGLAPSPTRYAVLSLVGPGVVGAVEHRDTGAKPGYLVAPWYEIRRDAAVTVTVAAVDPGGNVATGYSGDAKRVYAVLGAVPDAGDAEYEGGGGYLSMGNQTFSKYGAPFSRGVASFSFRVAAPCLKCTVAFNDSSGTLAGAHLHFTVAPRATKLALHAPANFPANDTPATSVPSLGSYPGVSSPWLPPVVVYAVDDDGFIDYRTSFKARFRKEAGVGVQRFRCGEATPCETEDDGEVIAVAAAGEPSVQERVRQVLSGNREAAGARVVLAGLASASRYDTPSYRDMWGFLKVATEDLSHEERQPLAAFRLPYPTYWRAPTLPTKLVLLPSSPGLGRTTLVHDGTGHVVRGSPAWDLTLGDLAPGVLFPVTLQVVDRWGYAVSDVVGTVTAALLRPTVGCNTGGSLGGDAAQQMAAGNATLWLSLSAPCERCVVRFEFFGACADDLNCHLTGENTVVELPLTVRARVLDTLLVTSFNTGSDTAALEDEVGVTLRLCFMVMGQLPLTSLPERVPGTPDTFAAGVSSVPGVDSSAELNGGALFPASVTLTRGRLEGRVGLRFARACEDCVVSVTPGAGLGPAPYTLDPAAWEGVSGVPRQVHSPGLAVVGRAHALAVKSRPWTAERREPYEVSVFLTDGNGDRVFSPSGSERAVLAAATLGSDAMGPGIVVDRFDRGDGVVSFLVRFPFPARRCTVWIESPLLSRGETLASIAGSVNPATNLSYNPTKAFSTYWESPTTAPRGWVLPVYAAAVGLSVHLVGKGEGGYGEREAVSCAGGASTGEEQQQQRQLLLRQGVLYTFRVAAVDADGWVDFRYGGDASTGGDTSPVPFAVRVSGAVFATQAGASPEATGTIEGGRGLVAGYFSRPVFLSDLTAFTIPTPTPEITGRLLFCAAGGDGRGGVHVASGGLLRLSAWEALRGAGSTAGQTLTVTRDNAVGLRTGLVDDATGVLQSAARLEELAAAEDAGAAAAGYPAQTVASADTAARKNFLAFPDAAKTPAPSATPPANPPDTETASLAVVVVSNCTCAGACVTVAGVGGGGGGEDTLSPPPVFTPRESTGSGAEPAPNETFWMRHALLDDPASSVAAGVFYFPSVSAGGGGGGNASSPGEEEEEFPAVQTCLVRVFGASAGSGSGGFTRLGGVYDLAGPPVVDFHVAVLSSAPVAVRPVPVAGWPARTIYAVPNSTVRVPFAAADATGTPSWSSDAWVRLTRAVEPSQAPGATNTGVTTAAITNAATRAATAEQLAESTCTGALGGVGKRSYFDPATPFGFQGVELSFPAAVPLGSCALVLESNLRVAPDDGPVTLVIHRPARVAARWAWTDTASGVTREEDLTSWGGEEGGEADPALPAAVLVAGGLLEVDVRVVDETGARVTGDSRTAVSVEIHGCTAAVRLPSGEALHKVGPHPVTSGRYTISNASLTAPTLREGEVCRLSVVAAGLGSALATGRFGVRSQAVALRVAAAAGVLGDEEGAVSVAVEAVDAFGGVDWSFSGVVGIAPGDSGLWAAAGPLGLVLEGGRGSRVFRRGVRASDGEGAATVSPAVLTAAPAAAATVVPSLSPTATGAPSVSTSSPAATVSPSELTASPAATVAPSELTSSPAATVPPSVPMSSPAATVSPSVLTSSPAATAPPSVSTFLPSSSPTATVPPSAPTSSPAATVPPSVSTSSPTVPPSESTFLPSLSPTATVPPSASTSSPAATPSPPVAPPSPLSSSPPQPWPSWTPPSHAPASAPPPEGGPPGEDNTAAPGSEPPGADPADFFAAYCDGLAPVLRRAVQLLSVTDLAMSEPEEVPSVVGLAEAAAEGGSGRSIHVELATAPPPPDDSCAVRFALRSLSSPGVEHPGDHTVYGLRLAAADPQRAAVVWVNESWSPSDGFADGTGQRRVLVVKGPPAVRAAGGVVAFCLEFWLADDAPASQDPGGEALAAPRRRLLQRQGDPMPPNQRLSAGSKDAANEQDNPMQQSQDPGGEALAAPGRRLLQRQGDPMPPNQRSQGNPMLPKQRSSSEPGAGRGFLPLDDGQPQLSEPLLVDLSVGKFSVRLSLATPAPTATVTIVPYREVTFAFSLYSTASQFNRTQFVAILAETTGEPEASINPYRICTVENGFDTHCTELPRVSRAAADALDVDGSSVVRVHVVFQTRDASLVQSTLNEALASAESTLSRTFRFAAGVVSELEPTPEPPVFPPGYAYVNGTERGGPMATQDPVLPNGAAAVLGWSAWHAALLLFLWVLA
ncbi:Anti-sigma-I factor RsgI2 [Diplonema papillatum]|nr:Anti-sigma-I factor RsgI2 [Diplonema papillatum]